MRTVQIFLVLFLLSGMLFAKDFYIRVDPAGNVTDCASLQENLTQPGMTRYVQSDFIPKVDDKYINGRVEINESEGSNRWLKEQEKLKEKDDLDKIAQKLGISKEELELIRQ